MSDFLAAALGFPAVLFSFSLVVVVGYWCLVVLGVLGVDALDGDAEAGGGLTDALSAVGVGGIPATVSLSVMITVAWLVSLGDVTLLDDLVLPIPLVLVLGLVVLAVALACAWAVVGLLATARRRLRPGGRALSRHDFVGRLCVIRTGHVSTDFGQAEVTAADGSSALIQVRQTGEESLTAGSTALIVDHDPEGSFFWVPGHPTDLDPNRPAP